VTPPLSRDQIMMFQKSLSKILEVRYGGHWYMEEPDRGHAFRSISYENGKVDRLLQEAGRSASISSLEQRRASELILCIDPGHVSVNYRHSHTVHVLCDSQTGTNNAEIVSQSPVSCRT